MKIALDQRLKGVLTFFIVRSSAFFVAELRKTVNDNPEQVQLLEEVGENIGAWQEDVVEPAIALRRKIGFAKTMDDMADLIGEARGKQYFDAFRQLSNDFQNEETALMQERQEKNASMADMTSQFTIYGMIFAVILSSVVGFFIIRGPAES